MEKQYSTGTKVFAMMGLLLTTLIWGGSFVVMKNSVDTLAPTFLLAVRFTMAAVGLFLVFHGKMKRFSKESLRNGLVLGVFLELSYLFQTYGIKYTTASKNAFITTLYVIIVPFLYWVVSKKRPGVQSMVAAALAVTGLGLLTLDGDKGVNIGDLLTLCGGFCFAFHMIFIDRYTEKQDPIVLTMVQIAFVGVSNWFLAPVLDGAGAYNFRALADEDMILGLLFLSVFCTTIAFSLQNVCQKYLSANTSSLFLSTEAVFGTIFSVVFLKEVLSGKMILGCVLMFSAVMISELHIKKQER